MKEITFIENVEVKDHNDEIEFKANRGDSGELPESSANRWVRRGKAVFGKAESGEKAIDSTPVSEDSTEKEKPTETATKKKASKKAK